MHSHAERKRAYCLGMLVRAAVSAAAAASTDTEARRRRLRTEPPRPGGGCRAREGRERRGARGRRGWRARARGRGRARLAGGGAGRAPAGARPAGAAVRGARAGARQAGGGVRRGRHAPRAATCPRLGSRPPTARRGRAGKVAARRRGRALPRRAGSGVGGRGEGGLGAPEAPRLPRAAALEAGGESRVTAGSRGRRRGGGSNKGSRAKVASPGAPANLRTPCKAAGVWGAPRFGPRLQELRGSERRQRTHRRPFPLVIGRRDRKGSPTMSRKPPYRGLYIIRKSTDGRAARGYSFIHSTFGLLSPHHVPSTLPGAQGTGQSQAEHPPLALGACNLLGKTDDQEVRK